MGLGPQTPGIYRFAAGILHRRAVVADRPDDART